MSSEPPHSTTVIEFKNTVKNIAPESTRVSFINILAAEENLKKEENKLQRPESVLNSSLINENVHNKQNLPTEQEIKKSTVIKGNTAELVRQVETVHISVDIDDPDNSIIDRQIKRFPTIGPLSGLIIDLNEFLAKSKIDFEKSYKEKAISPLKITDFKIIKPIGRGTYGKVILTQLTKDQNFYAIKLIEKKEVVKNNFIRYVMTEKRVIQSVNFPFLVHLKYFFADFKYMYFVMPYIRGGDFSHYLHKHKPLKESHAKFYIGQLILALEYLHYMGIIHRDVKPENIIMDLFGYLKLGDFGQCIKCHPNDRAWTFVGTPEYMAPEVIVGKGYDYSIDWWSLGVVTFEVCAGRLPFISEKVANLYKLILTVKFNCPDCFSRQLKTFVRGLLVNNPPSRMANGKKGASKIKEMAWLKNTDWLALLNRNVEAPYVPEKIKDLGL